MSLVSLHLIWTALAALVITRQRRVPASAAAWIALVLLLPVAGTLLYVLVGFRRDFPPAASPAARTDAADRLQRLIARNCGSQLRTHNRIELLHNGNNAFSALIAALQRATRTIHMEYYIFRDDRIGRTIADILQRKARAGVEVRVIYDAVGSGGLTRRMLRDMRRAGIRAEAFGPLAFPWFTPRVCRRNHRKIVVTDGRIAFLGGINIAKYYLDGDCLGKWRDEHLRLEGDIVGDLQRLFLADWAALTGEKPDPGVRTAPRTVAERLPMQLAWAEEGASRLTLAEAFAAAIVRAQRTVRISSPYFMPPAIILDALRIAARSGVRVQLMIPACSDSRFTDLVSESYIGDLLDTGAERYRYDNGFLHAKLLVVDEQTASVGTANMDYRSLLENFEVTAFIYDRPTARMLAATFDEDLAACRAVTLEQWRCRPPWRRALCDALRLTAPLL